MGCSVTLRATRMLYTIFARADKILILVGVLSTKQQFYDLFRIPWCFLLQIVKQLIYTSLLLIIVLRFTCGEKKNCSTIKMSQNIMNMIVGTKLKVKLTILFFRTKFSQKRCFRSKTENVGIIISLYIFDLVYVPNFSWNR